MGEGTLTQKQIGASGRGASPSKSTDSAGKTLFKPTVHSNNGYAERTFQGMLSVDCFIYPAATPCNGIRQVTIKLRRYAQETAARLFVH